MPRLTEAHFEARRKQILEATFRCLAHKGYSRMTIRDIAGEAGISVGTLYLYFENKDEMVRALSEEARARTDASLAAQFPDAGPMEILRSIFGFLINRLDQPELQEGLRVDVQVWAEALHHQSLRRLFQKELAGRLAQFSTLIIEAQKAGALPREGDPEGLARIFMAILMGLQLQKAMEPNYSLVLVVESLFALLGASKCED